VVTGLAAAFVAGSSADGPAAPAAKQILIRQLAFGESPAGIHVGDTIEWVNKDIFVHSATADDKSFDVDIQPNGVGRFVVRKTGMIRYICKYHPGMTGTLVVER